MFHIREEVTPPTEAVTLFVHRLTAPWLHRHTRASLAPSLVSSRPISPRKPPGCNVSVSDESAPAQSSNGTTTIATAATTTTSTGCVRRRSNSTTSSSSSTGNARACVSVRQTGLLRSPDRLMVGRRTSDAGVDTRGMIDLAFDDGDEGDETAVDVFEGEA